MKKGLFHFIIFMMLVYLFNKYIHYFYFRELLPADLFRKPYKTLTSTEVSIWLFMLTWGIPGVLVCLFMKGTNFVQRVNKNWGVTLVGIVIFINVFFVSKSPIIFIGALIGGEVGAWYALFIIKFHQQYLMFPLGFALLVGTVKIFLTLKPSQITP